MHPEPTAEELRILHEDWAWAGRYAMVWIIFTLLILGGAHLLFDYLGADANLRILAFMLLATLIIVSAIWRAAGALAARLEGRRRQGKN